MGRYRFHNSLSYIYVLIETAHLLFFSAISVLSAISDSNPATLHNLD